MYPSSVSLRSSSVVFGSLPFRSVPSIFMSMSDLYHSFVPSIPSRTGSASSGAMLSNFTSSPFSSEVYPSPSSVHAVILVIPVFVIGTSVYFVFPSSFSSSPFIITSFSPVLCAPLKV